MGETINLQQQHQDFLTCTENVRMMDKRSKTLMYSCRVPQHNDNNNNKYYINYKKIQTKLKTKFLLLLLT